MAVHFCSRSACLPFCAITRRWQVSTVAASSIEAAPFAYTVVSRGHRSERLRTRAHATRLPSSTKRDHPPDSIYVNCRASETSYLVSRGLRRSGFFHARMLTGEHRGGHARRGPGRPRAPPTGYQRKKGPTGTSLPARGGDNFYTKHLSSPLHYFFHGLSPALFFPRAFLSTLGRNPIVLSTFHQGRELFLTLPSP